MEAHRCYVLAIKQKRGNPQETNVINNSLNVLEAAQCNECQPTEGLSTNVQQLLIESIGGAIMGPLKDTHVEGSSLVVVSQ